MAILYGIGVGPGDKDLITLKAIKILQKVDIVIAPSSKGEESIAFEIAKPYINCQVIFMEFPMTYLKQELKQKWQDNINQIKGLLDTGKDVAFITLGDPMIYSTYIYILKGLKGYKVETIPGITSYSGAASAANIPIAEGQAPFAVIPSGNIEDIKKILNIFDNVILMKITKKYSEIVKLLHEENFTGKLIIKTGHEDEIISSNFEEYIDTSISYLSLIIAKKVRKD